MKKTRKELLAQIEATGTVVVNPDQYSIEELEGMLEVERKTHAYIGRDKSGMMILCLQVGAGTEYYEVGRFPLYIDDSDIEKAITKEFEIE